jgi:hypothetical protein
LLTARPKTTKRQTAAAKRQDEVCLHDKAQTSEDRGLQHGGRVRQLPLAVRSHCTLLLQSVLGLGLVELASGSGLFAPR